MKVLQKGTSEWLATMAGGSKVLGSNFIDGTITNGQYQYLVINAEAVFTTISCVGGRDLLGASDPSGNNDGSGLNLSGATLAVGMVIVPPSGELIENIVLASGSVLAYG
jgi:hypothetical protein|tara:strand:+ start:1735 stop:2061 length:327 start_codon:yes stop_codon:yes gene_type:complete